MTTLLIRKQDGNDTKNSRETCRILRLRRPHGGRIPHGKIEWLFFFKHAVSDCRNVVPTIRREVYTEYTPVPCIMDNTVFSQALITYVVVAQELNGSE